MQTTNISAALSAPRTSLATSTPASAKGRVRSGDRFQTVSGCPAPAKARARADPIRPSPITVIAVMRCPPIDCDGWGDHIAIRAPVTIRPAALLDLATQPGIVGAAGVKFTRR